MCRTHDYFWCKSDFSCSFPLLFGLLTYCPLTLPCCADSCRMQEDRQRMPQNMWPTKQWNASSVLWSSASNAGIPPSKLGAGQRSNVRADTLRWHSLLNTGTLARTGRLPGDLLPRYFPDFVAHSMPAKCHGNRLRIQTQLPQEMHISLLRYLLHWSMLFVLIEVGPPKLYLNHGLNTPWKN